MTRGQRFRNMNNSISVCVYGENSDTKNNIKRDLEQIGLKPVTVGYPEFQIQDLVRNHSNHIILDLSVYKGKTSLVGESFLQEGIFPPGIDLVGVVSEFSTRQIPFFCGFSEVIKYPCEITELDFRLNRIIHRCQREGDDDKLSVGNLTILPSKYEVRVDDQPVTLSHIEYGLFNYLITNPGHVFTREELFHHIWGDKQLGESRTVDVHIRRLRVKIGDVNQKYIKTVRRIGYTFRFDSN